MTSSIPDGLSTADLQAMLADAATRPEEQIDQQNADKVLSEKEISKIVISAVMSVREDIGDISAYKHVAMFALYQLFKFHNEVCCEQIAEAETEDDAEAALCWGRDAGWIQVCMNTLRNVGCGPQDHWVEDDEVQPEEN